MKIYLAGPTPDRPTYNPHQFEEAAKQLQDLGHEVVNPGRHDVDPQMGWGDYARRGLSEMLECDGLALLEDWQHSSGARLGVYVATQLDMDIRPLELWAVG